MSRADALVLTALLAAVGALFAPGLGGGVLTWDDTVWLGDPLIDAPLAEAVRLAFGTLRQDAWYPVLRLSWWAQEVLFGREPWRAHAVNLGFWLGSVGLAFGLLRRLGLSTAAAGLATLLWAVHPTRVESVAWLTSRKDVLSVLLLLGSTHALIGGRTAFGTVLFTLAALTKVAVAPLAALIWLVVRAQSDAQPATRTVGPALAVGLLTASIGGFALQGQGATFPDGLSWPGLVAWLEGSWWARLVDPYGSVAVVPVPDRVGLQGLIAVLGLVALGGAAVRLGGRWGPVLVGGWVVPLLPVHGLVPMAFWAADRHLLVPSLAVAAVVGLGLERAGRWGLPFGVALAALFAHGTFTRIPAWRSDLDLWQADLAAPGQHWARHLNGGTALGVAGRFDEAAHHLRLAEQLHPDPVISARRILAELAADGWTAEDARAAPHLQPPPTDAAGWRAAADALDRAGAANAARDARSIADRLTP